MKRCANWRAEDGAAPPFRYHAKALNKKCKLTEYVFIGILVSATSTLVLGLLVRLRLGTHHAWQRPG